jgi:hypothetical protein
VIFEIVVLGMLTFELTMLIELNFKEDDIYPYIRIEDPDEIVIPMKEIRIEYDYPLTRSTVKFLTADNESGFTRIELARKISYGYQEIYQSEQDPGMLNRAASDEIWRDLVLNRVKQIESNLFGLSVIL